MVYRYIGASATYSMSYVRLQVLFVIRAGTLVQVSITSANNITTEQEAQTQTGTMATDTGVAFSPPSSPQVVAANRAYSADDSVPIDRVRLSTCWCVVCVCVCVCVVCVVCVMCVYVCVCVCARA